MPIVSGNVSLYNETDGTGILPTPTIGAVGLLKSAGDLIAGTAREGHVLLLVGETGTHLGQSALLAEAFNREDGDAPNVDLAAEKLHGDFIRANAEWIDACTDLADGGLALAAFEMAETAETGIQLDSDDTAELFGEDQARYLIACSFDKAEHLMIEAGKAGVPIQTVGKFGGDQVVFGASTAPLADLASVFRSTFAQTFA
jgi:phosphoribosylformylglycinamidine synthase